MCHVEPALVKFYLVDKWCKCKSATAIPSSVCVCVCVWHGSPWRVASFALAMQHKRARVHLPHAILTPMQDPGRL